MHPEPASGIGAVLSPEDRALAGRQGELVLLGALAIAVRWHAATAGRITLVALASGWDAEGVALLAEQHPGNSALQAVRARMAMGDAGPAIHATKTARRRAPSSGDVCYDAAVIPLQVGEMTPARDALRCVLEFTPQQVTEVYALGWAASGKRQLVREAVPRTTLGWRKDLHYARAHRSKEVPTERFLLGDVETVARGDETV